MCSIVAHAVNNGILATMSESPDVARMFGVQPGSDALPWPATLYGTILTIAALFVLVSTSEGGMFLVRNRTGAAREAPGTTTANN